MFIIVTRENPDGTFDSTGMTNRTFVSDYKTLEGALDCAVRPANKGKRVQIQVYKDAESTDDPIKVFVMKC